MDTSSRDYIPPRQIRAGRVSPAPGVNRGSEVAGNKPASLRPSTGRLTSPVQERRVALRGQLTRVVASCCIARLVVLAAEDQRDPIFVHIDSPGGSIAEAMGILSTMNGIRCPVITFCRREAMGPAAIIAAHGLRGYRAAAPVRPAIAGATHRDRGRHLGRGWAGPRRAWRSDGGCNSDRSSRVALAGIQPRSD